MVLGKPDSGGISASNGGLVLLVEDDDRISRLERFVLEQVGYRVACAGSGEEALELLPQTAPSLVLLDVMLPKMDGFTTCQKIRETSQVPIIMVTARDRDADKVRGLKMGANDYITKPFSTHELASRVKSVLRGANTDRDKTDPSFPASSEAEMFFLHPRDEAISYPTQAPLSSTGIPLGASDHLSGNETSANLVSPRPASPGNDSYEGAVKLVVETPKAVKELIRFIDALRGIPQIHLLRMLSNSNRSGMDVWIRLRSPNHLRTTLLSIAGVSTVEVSTPLEHEPDTTILKVLLD
jgi:CheY-like chemotaxis protein